MKSLDFFFKKSLLLSLLSSLLMTIFWQRSEAQTTYYLANNGNDNNSGTSTSTPFQTLAKINSIILKAGDKVLLRKGDVFRGTLSIDQSGTSGQPIIVDAYGTGSKPTISGSVPVTTWISIGNNKWQATCPQCATTVTGLYIEAVSQPLGRYPNQSESNRGYLTVNSHAGKTKLVSTQTLTTDWTGGEVVVRPTDWVMDRAVIAQQNSNTLTINNNSSYNLTDGNGYFIQNHPATLDQNGEWYYNKTNKQFTLYYTLDNPNNKSISATAFEKGVQINKGGQSLSYINVQNIRVTETMYVGINPFNVSNLTVSNCEITNSGLDGIYATGTGSNVTFEGNLVYKVNNNAFQIAEYNNFTFRGNTIRANGLEPGRGGSGDAQYIGFRASSLTGTLIESNILDSIGYTALNFPFANTIVRRNIISNFCLTKSDGGGLYIIGSGAPNNNVDNITLQENIIYNGIGAPEGTVAQFRGANGIYLDQCSRNISIQNNTTFRCHGFGIYILDSQGVTTTGNTSFDNDAQYGIDDDGVCAATSNIVTQNNIFVAKLKTQFVARYQGFGVNIGNFGSFDNNYYARPFDDVLKLQLSYPPPNGSYNYQPLSEWQSRYGKDINSKNSPISYKGYSINSLSNSELIPEGNFSSGTGSFYSFSDYNNSQVTFDNANKLDGTSLKFAFSPITNTPGSSLYLLKNVNVSKDHDYILRFDAIGDASNRVVEVYFQTTSAPFMRIVETSPGVLVGPTRKSYEVVLRPLSDQTNPALVFRIYENNQPIWLDNISLQEASITRVNPDDLVKLVYNPTNNNTTINLDGNYIDVKNQLYKQQIILAPFGSAVLLKATVSDLTPIIRLPQANFASTGDNAFRYFTVELSELNNVNTSGDIIITVTVPVGYTLTYNNNITAINVSGESNNPIAVDNTRWDVINTVSSRQLTLKINNGQFLPASGTTRLGFNIIRTQANSGSTSNITANINNDINQAYDINLANNIYARIINAL